LSKAYATDSETPPRVVTTRVGLPNSSRSNWNADTGFCGTATGVAGRDGFDAGPAPFLLDAVTVKVYAVPGSSPLTTAPVAPGAASTVFPPGEAVMT
jgi:hypothetical protein